MKRIVTFFVVMGLAVSMAMAASGASAKNEGPYKVYDLPPFGSMNVSSVYHVTLTRSQEQLVEVWCNKPEAMKYLVVKVQHGTLYLGIDDRLAPRRGLDGLEVKANVSVDRIHEVKASGVANIFCDQEFRVHEMEFDLSGSSNVYFGHIVAEEVEVEVSGAARFEGGVTAEELSLDTSGAGKALVIVDNQPLTSLEVDASGASSVTISGEGIRAEVSLSGSSLFKGLDFKAEGMKAELSGASKAEVFVEGTLIPELSGASRLRYNKGAVLRRVETTGSSRLITY